MQREAQAFQVLEQKKCKLNSSEELRGVVHIYWQTNIHVTALSTWEEAHLRGFSATTCLRGCNSSANLGLGIFSGEKDHNDTPGVINLQTNPSTSIAQRKRLEIRSSVVRKKAGTCEQNGLSMSANIL